jgi:hypothetical protein
VLWRWAGRFAGAADFGSADFGSAGWGAAGSGAMILTGGIESADGNSYLLGLAAVDGARTEAAPVAPSEVAGAAATVAPFGCQASACTPTRVSNARDFMLARTALLSRKSRRSGHAVAVQPRVVNTWATRPKRSVSIARRKRSSDGP